MYKQSYLLHLPSGKPAFAVYEGGKVVEQYAIKGKNESTVSIRYRPPSLSVFGALNSMTKSKVGKRSPHSHEEEDNPDC